MLTQTQMAIASLSLHSSFLPPNPHKPLKPPLKRKAPTILNISCTSTPKRVRDRKLDKHVTNQNRVRFVQKLKTLLLSKPKHYLPLHILSKCRPYLSLDSSHTVLQMIRRYPSLFELFSLPSPPVPSNATKISQLCVRLTPAAERVASEEKQFCARNSVVLATKLQKLLMMSSHKRLLLSKLVHLGPDLGFPANFRSRLCNDFPDRFRTLDTSYGRALELVSWDDDLAWPVELRNVDSDLIVDRPLKFKQLRLRKGVNVKRSHREFLVRFGELGDVCPYRSSVEVFKKESIEAEKRACAVVREVLYMTVEKRTLIDHLTHFRKDFGFPNKLRAMILRHPEMFYVSLKGLRDSVMLVECFDEKGVLLEKDESLGFKERWMELVRESKRMRRERRKANTKGGVVEVCDSTEEDEFDEVGDEFVDGFEDVFEDEDFGADVDFGEDGSELSELGIRVLNGDFWSSEMSLTGKHEEQRSAEPW